MNYILYRTTLPARVILTLIPICTGVAVVSYFDTKASTDNKGTTPSGAVFALTGIVVSAGYTTLVARSHKTLNCSSQQLLFNQAPISVLLMLFMIPFMDHVMVSIWFLENVTKILKNCCQVHGLTLLWFQVLDTTPPPTWLLILLVSDLNRFSR